MADPVDNGICQETSGFLFSHRCDRIAMRNCIRCGKAVCNDHGHDTPDGVACTSCVKNEVRTQSTTDPSGTKNVAPGQAAAAGPMTSSYRSSSYYDDPYFYGYRYYPGYYGYGYHSRYGYFHSSGHSSSENAYRGAPDSTTNPASHDPNDFTEGDAESLRKEGDESFESGMGDS